MDFEILNFIARVFRLLRQDQQWTRKVSSIPLVGSTLPGTRCLIFLNLVLTLLVYQLGCKKNNFLGQILTLIFD